jgi:hypothetical protein
LLSELMTAGKKDVGPAGLMQRGCHCVAFDLRVGVAMSLFILFDPLILHCITSGSTCSPYLMVSHAVLQVGVAMSLFILFDPLIESDEYKAHCVFFMAIMAFATVLINGSTAKYVLKGLGLLRMTPQQVQVLEHVLQVRSSKREVHMPAQSS